MKKIFVAMAFFFALGTTIVSAQDAPKPKKQVFGWNKQYMDEIGIAPEVQAKIEIIKLANDAEQKALRERTDLSPEEKKVQLGAIITKRREGIKNLLSPEEIAKGTEIANRIAKENAKLNN